MRKGCNVLKRALAVIFAFVMIASGICFMRTDANKVYAATSTVKESTGYNDEGYFVKQYEEISTYKTAGTYPILDGTEYKDAQDWLFAGWYTTEECTTSIGTTKSGSAWAKFVHIDVLSVKCQVENDIDADTDKTNMRLISTLDSLKYNTVGFKVRYNGGEELDFPVSKVFKRINASETNGNECGYSPVAFHETSEYFMTYSLLNIANKNFSKPFYIEPYWVTLDGTEVRGASRFARVEDRYLEIVNVPVRLHQDAEVTEGSVTINYNIIDSDETVIYEPYKVDETIQYDNGTVFDVLTVAADNDAKTVTVTATEEAEGVQAKGMLVNLRFQMIADAMPSTSTFEISSSDFNVSDFIFKNFPLTYSGGYDISWYTGYEDSDTFAIASAADLYGLAALSNGIAEEVDKAVNFANKTIYLASDITINEGNPLGSDKTEGTTDDWATTAPSYVWAPIGKTTSFAGVFDGQGNTISGIYLSATAGNAGMFAQTTTTCTIQNISIKNSYMYSTAGYMGSVVGYSNQTKLLNIYSDAYVIGDGNTIGGIVGGVVAASQDKNISSCWFDGTVTGDTYCGGIVGRFRKGTSTISNCLVTGSVVATSTNSTASVGGIVGGMPANDSPTLEISTSISVGSVTGGNAGGVIGYRASTETAYATLTLTDIYTTYTKGIGTQSKETLPGYATDTEKKKLDSSTLNGHIAYDTIDGFSFLSNTNMEGKWVIRETAEALKDGVPIPKVFADEWIDVAWYYDTEKVANKGEMYSISTAEELYGFSAISQDYSFGSDTIELVKDITANTGKASSWAAGTTIPDRQWKPIGKDTPFAGTFDGKEKTISGIYVNETTDNAGLFAETEYNVSIIKNIRLKNSYIYSSAKNVGSIIGYSNRTKLTNIYSNAYVESTVNHVGGIVGDLFNASDSKDLSKCWFDGSVKGSTYVGGIAGRYNVGESSISDVLVTGEVKSIDVRTSGESNVRTGGIIGATSTSSNVNLTIETSVHVGTVEDSYTGEMAHKTGGVIGHKQSSATVSLDSVYTTFAKDIGASAGTASTKNDVRTSLESNHVEDNNVYGNDNFTRLNLDYYLYDSIWVARKNDTTVPRCFVGTVVDENDIVEDTSAHTAWYDANPDAKEFEIKTENDLLGFAVIVNEGEKFSGKTIKLVKDMDLNRGWNAPETVDEEAVKPDIAWTPIGNNAKVDNVNNRFQGTFDGQGNEIKGIYVDSDNNYIGLFGYVNNNAIIKNLRLTNSYFYGDSASALGWGSITGQSENATLLNIYSDAVMSYLGRQIGGFVGRAAQVVTIERCWFDGEIDASYVLDGNAAPTGVGGIVGATVTPTGSSDPMLSITDCLNTGNLKSTATHSTNQNTALAFGGIFGTDWNKGSVTISGCLNKGELNTVLHQAVGAIVGRAQISGSAYEITGCYALDTSIKNRTFEDIGYINTTNKPSVTPDTQEARCPSKEIDQLVGEDVYAEGGLDLNYATWIARKNDVPVPTCFVGSVVAAEDTVEYQGSRVYADTMWYTQDKNASTYSIDTAHKLLGLAQLVNEGITTFDNKTINLVNDIDFNKGWTAPEATDDEVAVPVNTWMPIGNSSSVSFQGTFNGHGNTIKGIYVDEDVETTHTGLFGYTKTCTVTDLRLENSYFSTTKPYMGSIIGYGNGTLTNVYSDAIMHSTKIEVGGLVGRAVQENGSNRTLNIQSCWFNGDIKVEPSAASAYVGGLLGLAYNCDAIIDTCLYTGGITLDYTSTTITDPNTRSGGLFGSDNYSTTSQKTLADASISNTISAGTITGIIGDTAAKINNLCTTIGQVRTSDTQCRNVYDMSVVTKVIGSSSENSAPRYGKVEDITDETKLIINQTYEKEDIFGLGAQLLTTLDFVQDADETIWAARRGQIPAPAGLVADSDKLNVRFGKADTDIADGATGDSAEDPYVIENVEELYGFAVLSRTDNFAGKFIKLSDDIDVLDLNPGESAEDWAEGTAASLPWYSIGVAKDELRFAGHFDGNGKTTSGIYINDDSSYLGLFAATETGSTITNLRLTNSYINYTGDSTAYTGSVVGDLRGDMTEVYSDAIVNSNGTQTGGLIGQVNALLKDDDTYAVDITNCWYAGQLTSSKTYAGGLLASTANGTVNVDNCLNTGTITTTATAGNEHNAVAGICAQVTGASTVTITDTISAGKITDANHGKNVKSVVGYIPNGTVNFENVFATKFAYGRALPSEGASGAHTGTVIRTHKANRLIGYCVGEIKTGETAPKLDFVTDWTIRTTDVPVPTCFADLVTPVTFAEGSTLDATLNTQIGLDTLGLSIVNAIDMGEGNYVLETTADDTLYSNYVAKLENDLGFGNPVAENSAGAGTDGVHSVSYKKQNPDWVLTLTYVETTDVLTISINTDIDSLSDNLVYTEGVEDEDYMATGDITFSMLQMKEYTVDAEGKEIPVDAIYADLYLPKYFLNENSYWYGNSFVFQLPNGHFIVNDGGAREEFADLVTYLKTAAGTTEDGENPVYIDAWIVSHQHGDHFDVIRAASDALRDETSTLMDDIYVDAFYINEPNAKVLANASLDDDVDSQYNGMTLFTKGPDGEQADIYRMQTGQRYYFNGLVMDVIQAQEQIPYIKYGKFNASSSEPDFNTVSTVTLFTTSNNQKILIGGDANYANMQYIMDAYGIENDYTKSALLKNINVFVAFHHGKNMSMNINGTVGYGFIDYLTKDGSESGHLFDYVLYPCSLVYNDDSDPAYAFPNAGEANAYLNSKANAFEHFGNGNVEITLKGATTE